MVASAHCLFEHSNRAGVGPHHGRAGAVRNKWTIRNGHRQRRWTRQLAVGALRVLDHAEDSGVGGGTGIQSWWGTDWWISSKGVDRSEIGGYRSMSTVRIPADIDQDDKLLAGLSGRQLLLVVIPTVVLWLFYLATRFFVPLMVFAPIAAVVGGASGTLVVLKRDGISLDRFALAALRYSRQPKRYITTVDDSELLPVSVAALELPIHGIRLDGVVELDGGSVAVVCEAKAGNLNLQSELEQEAVTAAFGRFCNGIQDAVQFVIRTDPVDLREAARNLESIGPSLPAIALEQAARDHARFLNDLGARHDVVTRTVLVVFREKRDSGLLRRRVEDAVAALRPAGIELAPLDQTSAMKAIQRATSPIGPRMPLINEVVKGKL